MGKSAVTLVIGASLNRAADVLKERTGIPDFRFDGLMGLADCDTFNQVLARISGPPVPRLVERQRAQLMDALVDCHFPIGGARFGIAADPDLLAQLARFVSGLGGDVVAAVASARTPLLAELPCREVQVGDLEDLELAMRAHGGQLLFANSHGAPVARRLGVPLLRAGFPLYDMAGAHARQWIGYRGSRQAVFDLANLLAAHRQTVEPYRSIYWQGGPRDDEQAAADLRAFL
jgi:nitrogenase molybdenum-iron protein alpha/beta subunit